MSTRIFVTTGPESAGKTTLARDLSTTVDCPLVEEASRPYLTQRHASDPGFVYDEADLYAIARAQQDSETAALAARPPLLVCDTDLLVILVWSEVRFGRCDPRIRAMLATANAACDRTYLLCVPDIPWEYDPLRENPHDRDILFARYRSTLEALGLPYQVLAGSAPERLTAVLDVHNLAQ